MQSGTTHTVQLPCTCTIVERKVLPCRVFMYNAEWYHTHLPAALHMQQCRKEGAALPCVYVQCRGVPHTPSSWPARALVWKGRCCLAVCLCIMQSGTTHTFRLPYTCSSVERKVLHCRVFMYNAEWYHTHLPADLHVQQCGKEGARGCRKQSHVGPQHSLTEHRCSGGQDCCGHWI